MTPPARTIAIALDIGNAFYTANIHTQYEEPLKCSELVIL